MNSDVTFQDQLRKHATMQINAVCSQHDYRNFCARAKAEGVIPADAFSALVSLYAQGGYIVVTNSKTKAEAPQGGADYVGDHEAGNTSEEEENG